MKISRLHTFRARTASTFLLLVLGIAATSVRTASADLPFPGNLYETQPVWECWGSERNYYKYGTTIPPELIEPDGNLGVFALNMTLSACFETILDHLVSDEKGRNPTGVVTVLSHGQDAAGCTPQNLRPPYTLYRCFAAYSVFMDVSFSHRGIVEHYWRRGSAIIPLAFIPQNQNYVVRLSPASDVAESETTLTSLEPDKSTNLVAKVYDQNDQLVPNVGVKLTLEAKQDSGGHHHPDDTVAARTGTMQGQQILTDNTGPSGLQFSYQAPSVSGDYKIKASCTDGKSCTPQGPDTVWVGVKNLIPLSEQNSVYRLIGQNQQHPGNHYLTSTALNRVTVFAAFYHAKYPNNPVLYLNDASLERGGVFDLSLDWKSPHFEHCRGTVIDIRANGAEGALNITSDNDPMIEKLKEIGRIAGVEPDFEIPKDKEGNRLWNLRHFHTYLMGQEGLQCP